MMETSGLDFVDKLAPAPQDLRMLAFHALARLSAQPDKVGASGPANGSGNIIGVAKRRHVPAMDSLFG